MSRNKLPVWLIPVLIVGGCGLIGMFMLLGVIVVLLLNRSGAAPDAPAQTVASAEGGGSVEQAPALTSDELFAQATSQQPGAPATVSASPAPGFPHAGPAPGFAGGFGPMGPPAAAVDPAARPAALSRDNTQPAVEDDQPVPLADLVERVQPAIAKVVVDIKSGGSKLGSGFLFGDSTMVATNYHVIEGAAAIRVRFKDSGEIPVLGVAGYDQGNDLALLKISAAARRAEPLEISPDTPRPGEKAIAIGSPQGFSFTTSEGIVSAVRSGSEIREVLRGLSGADEYTRLGFSITNTWLQITTPISTGNSGGPLLNDRGQLIGVNTLTLASGQNLNLAIAAEHVRGLAMRSKGRQMIAVANLPASRLDRAAGSIPSGSVGPDVAMRIQITSPSGAVFDSREWEIELDDMKSLIDPNAEAAVLNYESGVVYGVATHKAGVLDGFSVALYENKELMRIATYEEGSRHGKLAAWSELGQMLYFSEFFKGRNDGFCGLLGENGLELLLEYDKGALLWVHRIAGAQIVASYQGREEAAADVDTMEALDRLDKREEEIMTAEVDYRRDVRDYAQEERRARAAYLGAQKRARMQARINQRSAAQDALNHAVRRRAGY